MSLINQVLKDIDNRNYHTQNTAYNKDGSYHNQEKVSSGLSLNTKLYLSGAAGFALSSIIFMVGYGIMNHPFRSTHHQVLASASSLPVKTVSNRSVSSTSSAPSVISLAGISATKMIDAVDVALRLSSMPLVKVNLDASHQVLQVTLFNTQDITLPEKVAVPGMGDIAISRMQQGDHLDLMLKLPFKARLVKIDPVQQSGQSTLHLALRHVSAVSASFEPSKSNLQHHAQQPLFAAHGHHAVAQGMMNQVKASAPTSTINDAYTKTIAMIEQGRLQEATNNIRQHMLSHAADPKIVATLVNLLMTQGKYRDADVVASSALANYPHDAQLLRLQAQIQFTQGKDKQALGILSSWSPSMSRHPQYYGLMATIYLKQGEPSLAGALYRRLIELHSHQVKWWVGYGVAMQAMSKRNIALEAYQHAMKLGFADSDMRNFVLQQMTTLQR